LFDVPWCFAFFGGAACSGAVMAALSGVSAGAASTTFDTSPAAEADAPAGADAGSAGPGLTAAVGRADVVRAAVGAVASGNTAAVDTVGAAAFTAGVIAD
jgi:hypothetical protein